MVFNNSYIFDYLIGPKDTYAKLLDITNNKINGNMEELPRVTKIITRRYRVLRGPISSYCRGLLMLFLPILGHFVYSSNFIKV